MSSIILTLTNQNSDLDLEFDVLEIDIAQRWLREVQLFIDAGQPWDDAHRFYNFASTPWNHHLVVQKLAQLVDTINQHQAVIDIDWQDHLSQDDLNRLHHVFERYHGLYDQQHTNDWFQSAPQAVQAALADLNVWIHRYETLGDIPRFVATWRYKPQRQPIQDHDFQHFSLVESWGDLRLNYCEIGKNLYDVWHDNDSYISAQAFRPQHWFAFDFTVRFTTHTQAYYQRQQQLIHAWFNQNLHKFESLGYHDFNDPKLALGGITVARLRGSDKTQMLDHIDRHQCLKSIRIA